MLNYENPPFKRTEIRKKEDLNKENTKKTFFDLEENKKPFRLLKNVPVTWGTGVSYNEEKEYTLCKKIK